MIICCTYTVPSTAFPEKALWVSVYSENTLYHSLISENAILLSIVSSMDIDQCMVFFKAWDI